MGFIRDSDGKKLGEGSYGIVWAGEITYVDGKKDRGAQKESYHKHEYSGFGSLREIQILHTLSSKSPFVPRLLGVFFDEYKRKPRGNELMKIEGINFVTEILDTNGIKLFGSDLYDFEGAIDMIGQFITAVAFIHDKLITHRDIKPGNILISLHPTTRKPSLKICDFGFSQFLVNSAPSTPGTNTPWYRAPEICWSIQKYGATSDVWAVACTIFEILTGKILFRSEKIDSDDLFSEIIKNNPNAWTQEIHASYKRNSSVILKLNGSDEVQNIEPGPSLMRILERSKYYKPEDRNRWISLDNILKSMLNYKYKEREPCFSVLNNPIFQKTRETFSNIISNIGSMKSGEVINISLTPEMNAVKVNFFSRFISKYPQFTPRILFHAVDLSNRVLNILDKIDPIDKNPIKVMIACIYFYHKYWITLSTTYSVGKFFEEVLTCDIEKPENLEEYYKLDEWIFNFEINVIKTIFPSFRIYRPGIFEMIDEYEPKPNRSDIIKLFLGYIEMNEFSNGSYRKIYRILYNKCVDPNYFFPVKP
uniref:Protein kinase domain-containing protein n=1 Tax=viral metagenome TaxID=1070528 RepID=A0A6C0BBZ8_9ZZZZ